MARRSRRTSIAVAGATEAARIAQTLGTQARAARRTRRQPLRVIARSLGISVTRLAELERGEGARAPLKTWIALGAALERPLAVNFSRPLGEPGLPTDFGHLEIQEHILWLGRATGRPGTFELPTRPTDPARSTDVGLNDAPNHTGSMSSAGTPSAISGPPSARRTARSPRRLPPGRTTASRRSGSSALPPRTVRCSPASLT